METATLHPKDSQQEPHLPKNGPRSHNIKPNKQTANATIQKNILTLTDDIQTALATHQTCKIPEVQSLLPLLQRAHICLSYQAQDQNISQALIDIQSTLKSQQPTPTANTWAQVAAQHQPTVPRPPPTPIESNTLIIRIERDEDRTKIRGKTNKEILDELNNPQVIAVKKLESGDIRIFAGSGAAKARLLEDQRWIQEQYPSSCPSIPQYQAIVHRVRVAGGINPAQIQALQKIQEENGRLHPNMKVIRASWLKSPKAREGKTHSSLILSVQSAQQVRDLVKKGLVHNGTLLIAEEFHPQQRATQCLNCGLFSHIAKYCRAKTVCGKCSGDHRTDTCQSTASRCSNCKGNHPSWASICKIKQAAKLKARSFQALITRKWENSTPHPTDQQEEWTTIPNPRKRRNQASGNQDTAIRAQSSVRKPPGRPVGTTDIRKAGTHPGQNKLSFPQAQNTDSFQKGQMQDTESEEDEMPEESTQQQTNNEQ